MLNGITTRTSTPQEDAEPWPGGSARPVLDYLTGTLGMTGAGARELLKAARTAQAQAGPGALADYPVPGGDAHLLIHYAPGSRAYRFKLTAPDAAPGILAGPDGPWRGRETPHGSPAGGLASLEAETIFLPCTSGLPDTSPAEEGGQPGDAEELAAWAAGLGLEAEDLDDLIHDAYSKQASGVNNGGLDSQVRFLIESYGTEGALSLLSDLRPEAAGRASPAAVQPRLRPARSSARRRLPAGSAGRLGLLPGRAAPPARRAARPAFTPAGGRSRPRATALPWNPGARRCPLPRGRRWCRR